MMEPNNRRIKKLLFPISFPFAFFHFYLMLKSLRRRLLLCYYVCMYTLRCTCVVVYGGKKKMSFKIRGGRARGKEQQKTRYYSTVSIRRRRRWRTLSGVFFQPQEEEEEK